MTLMEFATKPYFADIVSLFGEACLQGPARAAQLNELAQSLGRFKPSFVDDDAVQDDTVNASVDSEGLYYEQIIFQRQVIPTRYNWHDTFNGLIWLLFPKTKAALNHLHCNDIAQCGLHPRTRRRNRMTHFDECGGIIVYENDAMLDALQQHRWKVAFIERRGEWQQQLRYFIFGHALYEMLLQPHIGLTGKYLAVKVNRGFWQLSLSEQYAELDEQLLAMAVQDDIFAGQQRIYPLPLLGIPDWHPENYAPQFYDNSDYFRPLRTPANRVLK